ncbi:DUF6252 family protein [Aureisphaera galaxeae]|uniref:DUF6252 family protein n=1 Tax=Aureisphaera galaxeae TaxID=1538023 RepID=UPI00234FC024|nr:DUF6252 family protein [Aureisphaera galaxeae]MDC8002824.1 DUF6252 family protein [Aureisphaera galaxeae]
MRRLILLVVLVATAFMAGCETTEDNSPALQGQMEDFFYKAADVRAQKNVDGTYTIQGVTQDEKLTLHLRSGQLLTYPLGEGSPSYATYEDPFGNVYTTSPYGSGEITLTDRCISCGWLTGKFTFTAIQEGIDTITVDKGVFFKVSFLEGGLPGGDIDPQASDGTMSARVGALDYDANTVIATLENDIIKIEGFQGGQIIKVIIPFDGVSGNYNLPTEGFSASLTTDGTEDPAVSGLISINFNNTTTRQARVFFSFVTAGGVEVTMGNTRVNY